MDFEELLRRFVSAGTYLQEGAVFAVNRAVTVRSWFFGVFIVEYEQNGEDRAQYGERLIERLSASLRRCEKIKYNHFSVDRRDIPVPPMKVWQDKNVLPIGL